MSKSFSSNKLSPSNLKAMNDDVEEEKKGMYVCMYVCMCACMYIRIYIYVYMASKTLRLCMYGACTDLKCMYVCMCVRTERKTYDPFSWRQSIAHKKTSKKVSNFTDVCTKMFACLNICKYICMYVCMNICKYVCMYVCMYI